jgi:hypothetical protein
MIRINYRYQIWQFILLVIIQLPLLYKFILFNTAIGFFYLGFLIFFPFRLSPIVQLTTGFLIGLMIDVFSNTPGMHASAAVFVMFVKDYWLVFVSEDPEEEINISIPTLGPVSSVLYALPLILVHHLIIFMVEYGRWEGVLSVLNRVFWSSLLSFATIYTVNLLIAPKKRRS